MKKTIYNKIDKKIVGSFPRVVFSGRIITIISPKEADKAVDYLLSMKILGVDTETRPAFRKGSKRAVSLLQVSTDDTCFLFRLCQIGMPPSIIRLLSNKEVPMVGLSWHDDLCALKRRQDFPQGNFIDIQDLIGSLGIEDKSLQKIYANLFHQKISKRQRLSNWDADVLTEQQKQYAATDAWACLKLYDEIQRLHNSGDYTLIVQQQSDDEIQNNSDDI